MKGYAGSAGFAVGKFGLRGLAQRGLQQTLGGQQVAGQALLDDAQPGRGEQDGFRLQLAADVFERQHRLAGRQLDAARLADQPEVLVVDREDEAAPVLGRQPQFLSRSEEHTSELQSLMRISYAVFCLKNKKK